MIKKYEIRSGRYVEGTYWNINDLCDYLFDTSAYVDRHSDELKDTINEQASNFEYGGREWSPSEVLEALDELDGYLEEEANYILEDLEEKYRCDIEHLHNDGDYVCVDELDYDVYCVEEIPETAEEAKELNLENEEGIDELHDLLLSA